MVDLRSQFRMLHKGPWPNRRNKKQVQQQLENNGTTMEFHLEKERQLKVIEPPPIEKLPQFHNSVPTGDAIARPRAFRVKH